MAPIQGDAVALRPAGAPAPSPILLGPAPSAGPIPWRDALCQPSALRRWVWRQLTFRICFTGITPENKGETQHEEEGHIVPYPFLIHTSSGSLKNVSLSILKVYLS